MPDAPAHDPRTARDPASEREFLHGAEQRAGLDIGWAEKVGDRLATVGVIHGDRYRTMSDAAMLREIECEGFDLGGWPVLLALNVNAADLDDEAKLEVRMLLQEIAAFGVRVSERVERVREILL